MVVLLFLLSFTVYVTTARGDFSSDAWETFPSTESIIEYHTPQVLAAALCSGSCSVEGILLEQRQRIHFLSNSFGSACSMHVHCCRNLLRFGAGTSKAMIIDGDSHASVRYSPFFD